VKLLARGGEHGRGFDLCAKRKKGEGLCGFVIRERKERLTGEKERRQLPRVSSK
jgi:hypothetical protein